MNEIMDGSSSVNKKKMNVNCCVHHGQNKSIKHRLTFSTFMFQFYNLFLLNL